MFVRPRIIAVKPTGRPRRGTCPSTSVRPWDKRWRSSPRRSSGLTARSALSKQLSKRRTDGWETDRVVPCESAGEWADVRPRGVAWARRPARLSARGWRRTGRSGGRGEWRRRRQGRRRRPRCRASSPSQAVSPADAREEAKAFVGGAWQRYGSYLWVASWVVARRGVRWAIDPFTFLHPGVTTTPDP